MSEHEVNKNKIFVNDHLQLNYFILTNLTKFSLYQNFAYYGIPIGKIVSAINYLEEIISEIVDFDVENENKPISQLLNDEELNNVKEKLLDFLENYLENEDELQNHSSCLKIINLWNKFVDLQQNPNKILLPEECEYISNYLISIVNNDETEEINRICSLIDNSPNGIDKIFVNSLLKLTPEYEEMQQSMKIDKSTRIIIAKIKLPKLMLPTSSKTELTESTEIKIEISKPTEPTELAEIMEPPKTESVPQQENHHEPIPKLENNNYKSDDYRYQVD